MQWISPLLTALFVVLQCTMHCYSRDQLLACNAAGSTWAKESGLLTTLRKAGICSLPTHRGCRGGKRLPSATSKDVAACALDMSSAPIETIVGNRSQGRQESVSLNVNNNTTIKSTIGKVKIGLLNCQSVGNKTASIVDHLLTEQVDILALTETWLNTTELDQRKIAHLTPKGYVFHQVPRSTTGKHSQGGGVGILIRSNMKVTVQPASKFRSFESIQVCITAESVVLNIVVIYRIPPRKENKLKQTDFLEEFTELLERGSMDTGKLLILGDFNIHWDDKKCSETKKFTSLLKAHNLEQHVSEPTHKLGHLIDFVITRSTDDIIESCEVADLLSDHHVIHAMLKCTKPHPPQKVITFRQIGDIAIDEFKEDILQSDIYKNKASDVADLVTQYDTVLRNLLDKHAPEVTKKVADKEKRPWINEKIKNAKRRRRRMERRWRKTRLTVHREAYKAEKDNFQTLLDEEKAMYFKTKIEDCEGDQKQLFSLVNNLLGKGKSSALPTHDNLGDLVNSFSDFFQGKIEVIRSNLEELEVSVDPLSCPPTSELLPPSERKLPTFTPATDTEIMKIIKSSSKATCALDPIPTKLLADHFLPELVPIITGIVNASMESGIFPTSLKTALVKPLLKKLSLDPEIFKNFRPVSNLSFLSKIIEKVVANRLIKHLRENGLQDLLQSAYKPGHSTESALLKVQNDILTALDNKSGVFLALIDLSAAFDTVDHQILLSFLKDTIGIENSALDWFASYLDGRTQRISIDKELSDLTELLFGVPQGSVLGPLKFCVYTLPIGAIIKSHGLSYHIYADDTQVYMSFDIKQPHDALAKLNACLSDIRSWMIKNRLKINDDKTEFLIIGSPHTHSKLDGNLKLSVGNATIKPSVSARNLGVQFNSQMSMENQVTNICKSTHYHLRNIGAIRNVLTDDTAAQLVHSLISSRLDYCNSLLIGLPDAQLRRLQKIQNHAARMVSRTRKFDHIQPVLQKLHWLPVRARINFKVDLLTYKALNGQAPEYIRDLLTPYSPARSLRSGDKNLLVIPRSHMKTYGDRCFSVEAPKLWNSLPLDIRLSSTVETFKHKLKTYMFRQSYDV